MMRCGYAVDALMIRCIYGVHGDTRNLNKREFLPTCIHKAGEVLPSPALCVYLCVLQRLGNFDLLKGLDDIALLDVVERFDAQTAFGIDTGVLDIVLAVFER